jgi:hypothetical protein
MFGLRLDFRLRLGRADRFREITVNDAKTEECRRQWHEERRLKWQQVHEQEDTYWSERHEVERC